jgi:hypothetical protein
LLLLVVVAGVGVGVGVGVVVVVLILIFILILILILTPLQHYNYYMLLLSHTINMCSSVFNVMIIIHVVLMLQNLQSLICVRIHHPGTNPPHPKFRRGRMVPALWLSIASTGESMKSPI